MSKHEKSCGIIPYTIINNEIYYLLVKETNGVICFPKGHVEENETEEETALRECLEETNVNVSLIPGYREETEYYMEEYDAWKTLVYFVGKINNFDFIKQDSEISDIKLCKYDEAYELQYDNSKELVRKADIFIKEKEFNIKK